MAQTFEVFPAWPDDERRAAFANAGPFIGHLVTVRFCGLTAAGVPRCGVPDAASQTGDVVDIIERTQQSERRS
jgi:hypothetical protein